MKKRFLMLSLVLVLAFSGVLSGCAKPAEVTPPVEDDVKTPENTAKDFTGKYIISATEVADKVGQENVILVDARGEETAKGGTIEGSIATVWQALATCQDGKSGDAMWGTILDTERLGKVLGSLGLSKDKEIILFAAAENGWGDDGRILWELVAAGYSNVKMVNGGYDAMVLAGLPVVRGAAAPVPTEVTIDAIDMTHVINTDELKANYDTFKVIDVRADEEYNGKVLYGEAKGGHLPKAIHIKFSDLFNEKSVLKSADEITAMMETAGITKTDKIVTYCTAGIRSAYMQLILEMCGFNNTQNYDESYYRWCAVNEVE